MNSIVYALVALNVLAIIIQVLSEPRHFSDKKWIPHAKYHLFYAILVGTGLNLVSITIALGPVKDGSSWAIWALAVAGSFIFFSGPLAGVILKDKTLPGFAFWMWSGAGVAYLILLAALANSN